MVASDPAVAAAQQIARALAEANLATDDRPCRIAIQAGYFSLPQGVDGYATRSMAVGLALADALHQMSAKNRVQLCLLVKDIGVSSISEARASLERLAKGVFSDPTLKPEEMLVLGERHMRNRGVAKLRRLVKKTDHPLYPLLRRVPKQDADALKLFCPDGNVHQLVSIRGDAWVGQCPVIMGEFYHTLLERAAGLPGDGLPVALDLSLLTDRRKCLRGADAARHIFGPLAGGRDGVIVLASSGVDCTAFEIDITTIGSVPPIHLREQLDSLPEAALPLGTAPIVYLDHQATTPTDPRVLEESLPYFSVAFGNAGSTHAMGLMASQAVDLARNSVAAFLGATPGEVVFTSGATEGNNLAIKGVATAAEVRDGPGHAVTVATEHPSVLEPIQNLAARGWEVTLLAVDAEGRIDLEGLKDALREETRLVSVMYANNEVGTVHPVAEIGALLRGHDAVFHCDATQGAAYHSMDVDALGVDLLTFSGHKLYAMKGAGVLYARQGLVNAGRLLPGQEGGGQERGVRSGTLNVPGIVALGAAVGIARECQVEEAARLVQLRDHLLKRLSTLPYRLNGCWDNRLPNNLSISFPDLDGDAFLTQLSDVAISTGSACHAHSQEPSHVLTTIGMSKGLAGATFRISPGRFTTRAEIDRAADAILAAYKHAARRAA